MASDWWDQSLASLHCRCQTFHSRKFFTFSADPLKNTNHNYFMCLFLIVYVQVVGGFWYWTTGYAIWVAGITEHSFLCTPYVTLPLFTVIGIWYVYFGLLRIFFTCCSPSCCWLSDVTFRSMPGALCTPLKHEDSCI